MRAAHDHRLAPLCGLLDQLLIAARMWSMGEALGDEVAEIRGQAALLNHARYVSLIPRYRRLAEQQGLVEVEGLHSIVNELMSTDALFKSYERAWLAEQDFERMTQWLSTIFVQDIEIPTAEVTSVGEWQAALGRVGVALTTSSGTSGQPSFVPRDRLTLHALRTSGEAYLNRVWTPTADGGVRPFDCLVLGPRGRGMGLLSGGSGLSRMATRAHFLFDAEMTVDALLAAQGPGASGGAWSPEGREAAFDRGARFAAETARMGRALIVFGAPFLVHEFCAWLAHAGLRIETTPDSLLVSGGGWKAFDATRIADADLHARIEETLGICSDHVLDTYGAAELNCVLMRCREACYHVPPLIEPVVLDDAYTGALGEPGEGLLGFLDPFALSYPGFVITGDRGRLVRGRCGCGLCGWAIEGPIVRASSQPAKGCGGVMSAALA